MTIRTFDISRILNVYQAPPHVPVKAVNDISWSPDHTKMLVSYYHMQKFEIQDNVENFVYIWDISKWELYRI